MSRLGEGGIHAVQKIKKKASSLFTFHNDNAIYLLTIILVMEYINANTYILSVMGKPIKSERHFLLTATIGTRSE